MPIKTLDDPVAQARQLIAEGEARFAAKVDQLCQDIPMGLVREAILEEFRACVPLHSLADPVLFRLVREMLAYWESPDRSGIEIDDWVKAARKVTEG